MPSLLHSRELKGIDTHSPSTLNLKQSDRAVKSSKAFLSTGSEKEMVSTSASIFWKDSGSRKVPEITGDMRSCMVQS